MEFLENQNTFIIGQNRELKNIATKYDSLISDMDMT